MIHEVFFDVNFYMKTCRIIKRESGIRIRGLNGS